MAVSYIVQSDCPGGGCCYPIALCNALRFHGLRSPVPGTQDWERLIDVALCRYGSTIRTESVERWLGVLVLRVGTDNLLKGKTPMVAAVHDPKLGLHCVLITVLDGGRAKVVNLEGQPDRWVEVADLELVAQEKLSHGLTIGWVIPTWSHT